MKKLQLGLEQLECRDVPSTINLVAGVPAALVGSQQSHVGLFNPLVARGFNPQPEPPGKPVEIGPVGNVQTRFGLFNPLEARGFNPQPEPPGKHVEIGQIV